MGSCLRSLQKELNKRGIMAREINMDTMRQNFWAESIKKETQLRRSWYSTHQSKEQSTKSMENSNQILQRRASKLRAFVPKAVDRKIEGYNENETEVKLPELKRTPDKVGKCAEIMHPVDNSVRGRLYNGITREGLGRHDYLKKRRELHPDDKYTYQLCSSWDYGWEMPQENLPTAKRGRTRIVRDTFYKRYGIFYDPIDV